MDTYRQPHSRAEAISALSVRRFNGENRWVDWSSFPCRSNARDYDIRVKPANTLHLAVWSGIPDLHVRSGHVTVVFRSCWGNVITVHAGASAHVVVPFADTKVTIRVEHGGTYTMDIPEGENRVYWPGKYDTRQPF